MRSHAGLAALILIALASGAAGQPGGQAPSIKTTLLAGHESVPPGGTTQLAVEIDLKPPWHMYHPIILDTGLPTQVRFTVPAGVTISNVRWPRPTYHDGGGIEYLELKGKFTALAEARVAADAEPGSELTIAATVTGLACVEACVPVESKASLTIRVGEAKIADAAAKTIEEARKKLPALLADAPYLAGSSLALSKEKLAVGESAEIVATLKVREGHHIQDRDPGVKDLVATRIFVESIDGLEMASEKKQVWPEAKVRDVPQMGKVRELSGEVKVRIPVKLTDEKFASGPVALRALVQYQCCTDAGMCYPPELVESVVRFVADTPNPPDPARIDGLTEGGSAASTSQPSASSAAARTRAAASPKPSFGLGWALVLAFLGGLILNIMPCVLPVISIKIVSFVQQANEDPRRVFRLGLAFALGILSWFWLLALITGLGSLSLRSSFQNPLQNPTVVLALGSVVFLMALDLFGVFEIILPGATSGQLESVAQKEGYPGAFFKGFVATLLGTACTAPFLAPALFYAFTQPASLSFLVFTFAGIGMASPYLLLSANPAWLKLIPRPGAWMATFKESMGFVLLGTAVWLLWVLRKPLGADGVVWTVSFWCFLGLAAWLIGRIKHNWSAPASLATWVAALGVAAFGYYFSFEVMYDPATAHANSAAGRRTEKFDVATLDEIARRAASSDWKRIPWQPYAPGLAEALAERGHTVYVDYTADWCWTCKTNLNTVLETDLIRGLMKELRVVPIEADFSQNDPRMREDMEWYGHLSVPMNLVYAAGKPGAAEALDILLTQTAVREALGRAGASKALPATFPSGQ